MLRYRLIAMGLLALSALWYIPQVARAQQKIDPAKVTIVRDTYGVPHIYGKTDAETAYGFAWAHAEDDFATIQRSLLAARGRLGEVDGKEGVLFDFFSGFLSSREYVAQHYETDLQPETRAYLEGYVQGLNDYAAAHPEEILLKDALPFTPQDVCVGYCTSLWLFCGAGRSLQKIAKNEYREVLPEDVGSNAMALNKNKTEDNSVMLANNSHQPLEGRFSWYEAHLVSEQGMNVMGGVFPGGASIFLGTSPNHAWAHTFNYNDYCDTYKLTLNPKNKDEYWFDGKWLPLTKRKIKLKVKLFGGIKITVKRTVYETVYGPAMKNKYGIFAVRVPRENVIKSVEQWLQMGKAQNLDGFMKALRLDGLPMWNIVYADREQNIYYISQGHYPVRNPKYNWENVLPGDTSATLWTEIVPFDQRPQYLNPECGYVFNANNSPATATCPDLNLRPDQVKHLVGFQTIETNRGLRLLELFSQDDKISWEEFLDIKYDLNYPKGQIVDKLLDTPRQLDAQQYPDIADALEALRTWNMNAGVDNRQAALFLLMFHSLTEDYKFSRFDLAMGKQPPVDYWVGVIRNAKSYLMKNFNKIDIALGEVQRHIRGKVSMPIGGLPDVLAAMTSKPYEKTQFFRANNGDSFIQLVQFLPDGTQRIQTVNAYGASNHPDSKHYTDQMELFTQQKTKPMTFDKAQILQNAERVYTPAEAVLKPYR